VKGKELWQRTSLLLRPRRVHIGCAAWGGNGKESHTPLTLPGPMLQAPARSFSTENAASLDQSLPPRTIDRMHGVTTDVFRPIPHSSHHGVSSNGAERSRKPLSYIPFRQTAGGAFSSSSHLLLISRAQTVGRRDTGSVSASYSQLWTADTRTPLLLPFQLRCHPPKLPQVDRVVAPHRPRQKEYGFPTLHQRQGRGPQTGRGPPRRSPGLHAGISWKQQPPARGRPDGAP
jgi:hypothetical protein